MTLEFIALFQLPELRIVKDVSLSSLGKENENRPIEEYLTLRIISRP